MKEYGIARPLLDAVEHLATLERALEATSPDDEEAWDQAVGAAGEARSDAVRECALLLSVLRDDPAHDDEFPTGWVADRVVVVPQHQPQSALVATSRRGDDSSS